MVKVAADFRLASKDHTLRPSLHISSMPGIEEGHRAEEFQSEAHDDPNEYGHGEQRELLEAFYISHRPILHHDQLATDAGTNPKNILVEAINSTAVKENGEGLQLNEEAEAAHHEAAYPGLPKAPKICHMAGATGNYAFPDESH